MPKHAKQLTELLGEREEWKQNASAAFLSVRNDTAMSQSSFAKEIGISQPYLNQIEHGKRTPSSGTLNRLLDYVEGARYGNTDEK